MIYYISDMHFGRTNVLKLDSRPFDDMDSMERTLTRRWNERVNDEDTVYVLGDAFEKGVEASARIMRELKGHKRLIRGNHDEVSEKLGRYWESIKDYDEIVDGGRLVILCHYPIPFYKKQHSGAIMLYGHMHKTKEGRLVEKWQREEWDIGVSCRLINVGCMMDYMRYAPRTLDEILAANPLPETGKKEPGKKI